jgi:hypothetical protein
MTGGANAVHALKLVPQRCIRARRFEVGQDVDVTMRTAERILVTIDETTQPVQGCRRVADQLLDDARIETAPVGYADESTSTVPPCTFFVCRLRAAAGHPNRAHDESATALPDLGASPARWHRPLESSPQRSAAVGQRTMGQNGEIARRGMGGSPCR